MTPEERKQEQAVAGIVFAMVALVLAGIVWVATR